MRGSARRLVLGRQLEGGGGHHQHEVVGPRQRPGVGRAAAVRHQELEAAGEAGDDVVEVRRAGDQGLGPPGERPDLGGRQRDDPGAPGRRRGWPPPSSELDPRPLQRGRFFSSWKATAGHVDPPPPQLLAEQAVGAHHQVLPRVRGEDRRRRGR